MNKEYAKEKSHELKCLIEIYDMVYHTMGVDFSLERVGESAQQKNKSKVLQNYGGGWFKQFTEFNPPHRGESNKKKKKCMLVF